MILGTRGSALAMAQTEMVLHALRQAAPSSSFTHRVIQTTGDLRQDLRLGRPESGADKGVWTKELEAALVEGTIQVAVHSAKDVPTDLPSGFRLAGCLPRAAVEDVLVSLRPGGLDALPSGATVATSSVRRACQLRHSRPDLRVNEIRGNVPTRLQKLAESADLDALVLARAGLDRLHYASPWSASTAIPSVPLPAGLHATLLPADRFLPAAAQGIVALEVFGEDTAREALLAAITHAPTWRALRAERAFLRLLQAGCHTPIGMLTVEDSGCLRMQAMVFPEDPSAVDPPRTTQAAGSAGNPEAVALAAFESLPPAR
ncbi:MAG: hydroxymethylbilane synthase [Verrucomicrobiales bacterium]